jgi:carboxylesterase
MFKPYSQLEHQTFTTGDSPKRALLIHGFPGTPAEVLPLAHTLAEQGWQIKVPLLPGFGAEIEKLNQTTHQDWLNAVTRDFINFTKDANQTLLVGFSMGGALCIAASATLKPHQLILIAPFSKLPDWRANFLPLLKYVMREVRPFEKADFNDPSVRAELSNMLPGTNLEDPEVQFQLRKLITLKTETLDQLRQIGQLAYNYAPRVYSPVVIIQGIEDKTVLPYYTKQLIKRFPSPPAYIEIPGGHDIVKPTDVHHQLLLETFAKSVVH